MTDRPPGKRNGPDTTPGRSRKHSTLADEAAAIIARGSDGAGELRAWGAAVAHLHAAGLPAAVPSFPAAWLARRGVHPDWVTAA
jgi:hypothetical protein